MRSQSLHFDAQLDTIARPASTRLMASKVSGPILPSSYLRRLPQSTHGTGGPIADLGVEYQEDQRRRLPIAAILPRWSDL